MQLAAGFCTAATGFTMIGLEMLLLLGFQAVYGYVYQQLAVVIAAFMAGMALGSWLAMRRAARGGMRVLAITQVLAAAAPLVLLGLFEAIGRANSTLRPGREPDCISRPGAGFRHAGRIRVSGCQPDLLRRNTHTAAPARRRPGTLYALDLAGSCLGAILFSAWLVPVFGFLKTALLSALVSLAPAAMAMLAGFPNRSSGVSASTGRRSPNTRAVKRKRSASASCHARPGRPAL